MIIFDCFKNVFKYITLIYLLYINTKWNITVAFLKNEKNKNGNSAVWIIVTTAQCHHQQRLL